ncbi:MAG: hypothetical protein J6W09_10855 [Bacteroidales bacterium]|nr:hypothetical protein [Bacteroidales bacterium]
MKKILVVCAAISLSCFLVRAQEAENTGSGAGLSVISRLDAGITRDINEGTYFNFGNTSLYTAFEGNISENWSFYVANHWIGSDFAAAGFKDGILIPTGELYKNTINLPFTGKSGNSFFDCAYLTYTFGDYEVSAGKLPLLVGGFEFDEEDYDVHPITTSTLWNSFFVYQYGATISRSISDGAHTFTAQIATNQRNNAPAFGFKWNGEIGGWLSTNYSILLSDHNRQFHDGNSLSAIISIGNKITYREFYGTFDYINRAGDPLYNYTDIDGYTLLMTIGMQLRENVDISGRYCLERFHQKNGDAYYLDYVRPNASLQVNWFPMDGLRVQGCAGLSEGLLYALVGATYTIDFKLW